MITRLKKYISKRQLLRTLPLLIIGTGMLLYLLSLIFVPADVRLAKKQAQALHTISENLQSIEESLKDTTKPKKEQLENYTNAVKSVENECRKMISVAEVQAMPDQVKKTTSMCNDVVLVTSYSTTLFHSVEEFILVVAPTYFNNSYEAQTSLKKIGFTIEQSLVRLDSLAARNDEIEYPGVQDLKSMLTENKLAVNLMQADFDSNHEAAASSWTPLQAQLVKNQQDALNHRVTYWQGTVGLPQLMEAVEIQRVDYCSKIPRAGKYKYCEE